MKKSEPLANARDSGLVLQSKKKKIKKNFIYAINTCAKL